MGRPAPIFEIEIARGLAVNADLVRAAERHDLMPDDADAVGHLCQRSADARGEAGGTVIPALHKLEDGSKEPSSETSAPESISRTSGP